MVYVNIRRHLLHGVGVLITPVRLWRLAGLEVRHNIAVTRERIEDISSLVMLLKA